MEKELKKQTKSLRLFFFFVYICKLGTSVAPFIPTRNWYLPSSLGREKNNLYAKENEVRSQMISLKFEFLQTVCCAKDRETKSR